MAIAHSYTYPIILSLSTDLSQNRQLLIQIPNKQEDEIYFRDLAMFEDLRQYVSGLHVANSVLHAVHIRARKTV